MAPRFEARNENLSLESFSQVPQNHVVATAALCACSLMNAYLMISVFPYAGYMIMDLVPSVNQDNVGTFAGLIASSFMAGRTLSALAWGKCSDVYGRMFVLKTCLILSTIFSLLFGLSASLFCALFWRFCLGLSNGLISTAKTAASELANGNQAVERRAMGLVVGMRSWGYLLSPAIGGLLADPVRQYPQSAAWIHQSRLHRLFIAYPFLLPNLVACIGCLVTFVIVHYFVDETLPRSKRKETSDIPRDVVDWARNKMTACCCGGGGGSIHETQYLLTSKRNTSYNNSQDEREENEEQNDASIWENLVTRRHLVVHWMFAFVSMCADEMFPLFCMSTSGGLSLGEASIGKILSGAGLLFALSQYSVFSSLVHTFGEYTCLVIGSIFGIQPTLFIPLSLLLGGAATTSGLSWSVFVLLSIAMAVCKLFGMLYFATLALCLNKTVPTSQRGTMNGLALTGASLTRSIAPTFAGALTTFSFAFLGRYGSLLMYGTLCILGAMVTMRVVRLQKTRRDETAEMEVVEESNVHRA